MIYVILGMHKSGTTMLSQILHDSGINMGEFDETKKYDEGNKYERLEPHDLNIEILGTSYTEHSLNVTRVITDSGKIPPALIQKMKDFVDAANTRYRDWGFKDPRTCLTYHLWKDLLPQHKMAAIYRHPAELWEHYRRQKSRNVLKYLLICWKALKGWYIHNLEILKILQSGKGDFFLAEYYQLMTEPRVFDELTRFAGRPLKNSINPQMYRSKKGEGPLYAFMLWLNKSFFSRDILDLYKELGKYAV